MKADVDFAKIVQSIGNIMYSHRDSDMILYVRKLSSV